MDYLGVAVSIVLAVVYFLTFVFLRLISGMLIQKKGVTGFLFAV